MKLALLFVSEKKEEVLASINDVQWLCSGSVFPVKTIITDQITLSNYESV